ncbi:hypothetical protein [Actinomycetospora atypica]|uniref:Flavoprotein n=1 Tax=Actinomycetospora atypica TaxID=1290095 RepID=A0ABV9YK94_9PSEU
MRIAVLGAGPVGLDTALAGVAAGAEVRVLEAAPRAGAGVRAWGHVRLFTPWSMDVSDRMRAAVPGLPDSEDECPTGHEFADRVLDPVAEALGPDVLRTGTRVLGVARAGRLRHEAIGDPARADTPFRILLTDAAGHEWSEYADVVVDATGSYGRGNPLGDGGLPAAGEAACDERIVRTLPDVAAGGWDGTTLLVGAGKSAQTAARDLAEVPGARVTWVVRDPDPDWGAVPDDPLPSRQALVTHAREHPGVVRGAVVDRLEPDGAGLVATLRDRQGGTERVRADRVLALTGYQGDPGLTRQVQVHECWATGAPMNLAASLLAAAGDGPADCLAQPAAGIDTLRSPEPDLFVLGMKSYGRSSAFLLRVGYSQVDEVVGSLVPA